MENDNEFIAPTDGNEDIVAGISENDIKQISFMPHDIDVKSSIASSIELPIEQSSENQQISSSAQNSPPSVSSKLDLAEKSDEKLLTSSSSSGTASATVHGIPLAVAPDPDNTDNEQEQDAQHAHFGSTAASDSSPSNLADQPKSIQSVPSQCESEMALSEALRGSKQSAEVNPCPKLEIAQHPDPRPGITKVELPGKLPNEHRIRNIGEVKVVLKACRPKDFHAIDDVQMATGQVLYPPAITYGANEQDREELGRCSNMVWKMPHNRRFLSPAQIPQSWIVAFFQSCDINACRDFIEICLKAAQRRGIRATSPTKYDMFENTDVKYVREKFEHYKKNEVQFVMFVTKDKLDPVYDTMKLTATKLGIITQNIPELTMKETVAIQVIETIVMNFNRKLGGINHGFSTSKAMASANRFIHDVVKQEWLRESRMFIGLDINHASLQIGEKSIVPTIVSPTQFVTNLVSALQSYHKEVCRFPQHIMVFRSGVSEGEYQKVATVEFGAFKDAFKELEQKHTDFELPRVTIIAVRHQSNYRIVPAQMESRRWKRNENVRAGTVVDEYFVNPLYTEFLLVAHQATTGTAHPTRYTVVVDTCNPRVPLEELEYVSYHLCYANGTSCAPTSVPAPLMAADVLKKRGRNNWKVASFGDDLSSEDVRFSGDGSEQFFIEMTSALQPSIPTKFWA